MPYFFILYFGLLSLTKTPLNQVTRSNKLIKEAEGAYLQQNYILALVKYRYLNNSLQVKDKNIQLNLAHCYFINKDTAQAKKYYLNFVNSNNKSIRAIACQQLGVLAFEQQAYNESLNYFKKALQADPLNNDVRFNYELVRKIKAKQEKTKPPKAKPSPKEPEKPEQTPPSPQQEPDASTNTRTEQQKEDIEKEELIEKRLKEINLSQERAQMILDAMKNSEAQYIQQKKRASTQQQDKTYPDW